LFDGAKIFYNSSDEWGTPPELFLMLHKQYHFTLDPCAYKPMPLHHDLLMFDKQDNGLLQEWSNHSVFINPPYSGHNIEMWMKKAYEEKDKALIIVMLIPTTKTGTRFFKKYAMDGGAEFVFITGRIKFIPMRGQVQSSNPLNSMIVIWKNKNYDDMLEA